MMRTLRNCSIVTIALTTFALNGCSLINAREENIRLRERIEKQEYLIELAEREAAIARGCEYIFNICPDSILESGQSAIKAGYSGGTSSIWMIFVAFKFTLITACCALFISILMRAMSSIRSTKEMDEIDREEKTRSTQEHVRQLVESAAKRVDELKSKSEQLTSTCDDLHMEAQQLSSEIEEMSAERDALVGQIENIKKVRQALDAFK
jgi:hypothetical protein